jgi:hypothetical protein
LRPGRTRTIRCGATFAYEYERDRLAIDLINGSPILRDWVDDTEAAPGDLDALARADESAWRADCADCLIYPE